METKSKFQRSFLIFQNEDSGYEAGQKPSGYIKIETREGKGRLMVSVQNLRSQKDNLSYELHLIKATGGKFVISKVGTLTAGNNGYSMEWAFDPMHALNAGLRVDDFDTAVILVKFMDRETKSVVCPLAAYRGTKTMWRLKAAEELYGIGDRLHETPGKVSDKYVGKVESKYTPREATPSFNINEASIQKFSEILNQAPSVGLPVTTPGIDADKMPVKSTMPPVVDQGEAAHSENIVDFLQPESIQHMDVDRTNQEDAGNIEDSARSEDSEKWHVGEAASENETSGEGESSREGETSREAVDECKAAGEDAASDDGKAAGEDTASDDGKAVRGDMTAEDDGKTEDTGVRNEYAQTGSEEKAYGYDYTKNFYNSGQYGQPAYDNINTSCMYMNGNMCGRYLKGGEANPCTGCRAYNNVPAQEKVAVKPGNIGRLKELLDSNFERSDPFNSRRSDYMWWKVANPVNLNNMMYECGIRSPLLFNPAVMMSHYKYRHLIIGVYTDRQQKQEYLVCGVPGMHMVDKKPFNDMCRWVQLEGSRPVYGAFGYWLVYIEPKTGKLLNIM